MGAKETASCIPSGQGIKLVLMKVNNCYCLPGQWRGDTCVYAPGWQMYLCCILLPHRSRLSLLVPCKGL